MNTYKKFCPHVFVAKCEDKHQKGDTIIVTTKRGKENEHIVHNLVHKTEEHYFYSITRADGLDHQEHYKKKAERFAEWADSRDEKSDQEWEKSNEGREFLSLGEPIKVGHHSERRHHALIERNHRRMERSVEHSNKADEHRRKVEIYESKSQEINLSMPESLEYFKNKFEEAKAHHADLKKNPEKRSHAYSLTYANKAKKEMKKKFEIAELLWK